MTDYRGDSHRRPITAHLMFLQCGGDRIINKLRCWAQASEEASGFSALSNSFDRKLLLGSRPLCFQSVFAKTEAKKFPIQLWIFSITAANTHVHKHTQDLNMLNCISAITVISKCLFSYFILFIFSPFCLKTSPSYFFLYFWCFTYLVREKSNKHMLKKKHLNKLTPWKQTNWTKQTSGWSQKHFCDSNFYCERQ